MNQKKNQRIYRKAFLCFAGILLLVYLAVTYHDKKVQEGNAPYIETEVVKSELAAISEGLQNQAYDQLSSDGTIFTKTYLTFYDLKSITKQYPDCDISMFEDYKRDDWYISKADWNLYLECLVSVYGNERIRIQDRLLVGDGSFVLSEEKQGIGQECFYTDEGIYDSACTDLEQYYCSVVQILTLDHTIVSVLGKKDIAGMLKNAYIVDDTKEQATVFHGGYYIAISNFCDVEQTSAIQGDIVDIEAANGQITALHVKQEYINGKLLRISEQEIEIEGYGVYPVDEKMQIYRLYQDLRAMGRKELRIGYAFTDFVLEDGKIAACLMMKEASMDSIRVLLRTSHLENRYHDEIELSCNQDMEMITYVNGVIQSQEDVMADETISFEKDAFWEQMKAGDYKRVKLVPKVLSGKIRLHDVERSQGTPQYPGTLEIACLDEGLIVINEVLLEDYLTRVVPSEMPSSYPLEALKSQAICARTYAYGKMMHTGLPSLGAHVDDSASFQVYNNINVQSATTEAVKSTHNTILMHQDEPIQAYYYSTSAGSGSEIAIWHTTEENPAYLTPREIGVFQTEHFATSLIDEERFDAFIRKTNDTHYESEEGWYRWTYERTTMDSDRIQTILSKRYEQNRKLVLVENEEGEFVSQDIPNIGDVTDIRVLKRLSGGVIDELLIEGTNATVKVISELNVRHVLSDGETKAIRQSKDAVNATMLPSAFLTFDLYREDGIVTGYMVYGGGFGHGVGMSQNGAKNMAKQGMKYHDILTFFYPGSEVCVLDSDEQ